MLFDIAKKSMFLRMTPHVSVLGIELTKLDVLNLTLFRLGGGGVDATQDLNPLLLTNDSVYGVPTS